MKACYFLIRRKYLNRLQYHPTVHIESLITLPTKLASFIVKLHFHFPNQNPFPSLPTRESVAMKTYLSINIGTRNTYIAVKEEGGRNPPRFIKKFKTEVMVPLKLDPHATTPTTKIPGFIRLIGKKFDDPIVQKEVKLVPYEIVSGLNGSIIWVKASSGFRYSPTVILESFLLKVKKIAKSHLGYDVSNFVLTFPSKVSLDQLNCTMEVMSKVGPKGGSQDYQVVFINEFAAAVAAYGLVNKGGITAIVDVGGRSLDVSLFQVTFGPKGRDFKLIGKETKTDMYFGGDDFDFVIAEFLVNEFKNNEGIDLTNNTSIIESLRNVAEKAKVDLSSSSETEINVPIFTIDASGGTMGLKVALSRSKFEALAGHLIEKIKDHCESHLKNIGFTAKNVDEVILVGGMAKVPMVKKVVSEVFGKSPAQGLNPEEAVALGAATAVDAGCLGLHPNCLDVELYASSTGLMARERKEKPEVKA